MSKYQSYFLLQKKVFFLLKIWTLRKSNTQKTNERMFLIKKTWISIFSLKQCLFSQIHLQGKWTFCNAKWQPVQECFLNRCPNLLFSLQILQNKCQQMFCTENFKTAWFKIGSIISRSEFFIAIIRVWYLIYIHFSPAQSLFIGECSIT